MKNWVIEGNNFVYNMRNHNLNYSSFSDWRKFMVCNNALRQAAVKTSEAREGPCPKKGAGWKAGGESKLLS